MKQRTPIRKISAKRAKLMDDGLVDKFTNRLKKPLVKKTYSIEEMKASGLLKKASAIQKDGRGERAKAKKKAWVQFSLFIRLRDSDENGIATCITSGRRGHWKTFDAGHFISRAKESVLFDERNVHAQSKQANRFQGGHFFEYEKAVDRLYGSGTAAELKQKAGMYCKRTTASYQVIEAEYRQKVEWFKQHQPGKFASQ